MRINVIFTTQLRMALGRQEEQTMLQPGATVQDALAALAAAYPSEFGQLVMRDGQLLPSILLSVNDKQVDANAKLSEGDTLTLLSAISGG